jgi:hypothetical protein
MSTPEMPTTIDDVPAWLREHARALNMRVLFVIADNLAQELDERAELEAAAWNAGATVVPMPEMTHEVAANLFRQGAFAMLNSIDRARREAEAGNAFAAGYLAELTGAPEHDYEQPTAPAPAVVSPRSIVQHEQTDAADRLCNAWHGYTHDVWGDYVCPGYPHPLAETVGQMHARTEAVSAGELPAPPGVPTTFVVDPETEPVDAWAERTGYAALHDELYGTERPDDEPAAGPRGLGRLLGRMFTTTAPQRPTCPHCGDRFRTHAELSTHVRDTGDQTERPPHACPVLWSKRNHGR